MWKILFSHLLHIKPKMFISIIQLTITTTASARQFPLWNYIIIIYNKRILFSQFTKSTKRDLKHFPLERLKYIWVHQVLHYEYTESSCQISALKKNISVCILYIEACIQHPNIPSLSSERQSIYIPHRWTHSFL